MNDVADSRYYVPAASIWPVVTAAGLALLLGGFAHVLHGGSSLVMTLGGLTLLSAIAGWFGAVIGESRAGLHNEQVDRSFRIGMAWFIFSEVLFFGAFFAALFYIRTFAIPWLGGEGEKGIAHLLWPDFSAGWPLLHFPRDERFDLPSGTVHAAGIPAFNTLVLLCSGVTVTVALWSLRQDRRRLTALWLALTMLLGMLFIALQVNEFGYAYRELNLTLHSGIYGSIFYLLTGFHGLHVTIGVVMLAVMLGRVLRGHFTPRDHFGFEATTWYWHFVDVVWLLLFVFVYWI